VIASTPAKPFVVRRPEQRGLPDGSIVELKAGAEISVDFGADGPGARRVALLHGEAHFQVSKNPARPFVVEAGGMEFRAVGTAFSVAVASDSVKMLVTEGRVAVAREPSQNLPAAVAEDGMAGQASVLVGVGERVVIDVTKTFTGSTPDVMATTPSEMAEILAWRGPHLEFNEMKLAQVVDLLRQHGGHRINLGSARLAGLEISGVLRADNVEPLLQMLEANYHIIVVRNADASITLQPGR
jgi:transmembrane sensor